MLENFNCLFSFPGNEPIQVGVNVNSTNYLLCTLDKKKVWQEPLDLVIAKDSILTFFLNNGEGTVYLLGYCP